MLPIALAIFLLAAPAAPAGPEGLYRLTGSPETASEILLREDGRFEYALAEGALDETASGNWIRAGDRVLLTTSPKPVPPVFSLAGVAETGAPGLTLKVVTPAGRGIAGVDFRIGLAGGGALTGYTQEDGWSTSDERKARSIQLAVPMFDLVSPIFPVDGGKGNAFTFVLTPNDLGRIDFESLALDLGSDRLVMHRNGRDLVYVRELRERPEP